MKKLKIVFLILFANIAIAIPLLSFNTGDRLKQKSYKNQDFTPNDKEIIRRKTLDIAVMQSKIEVYLAEKSQKK